MAHGKHIHNVCCKIVLGFLYHQMSLCFSHGENYLDCVANVVWKAQNKKLVMYTVYVTCVRKVSGPLQPKSSFNWLCLVLSHRNDKSLILLAPLLMTDVNKP